MSDVGFYCRVMVMMITTDNTKRQRLRGKYRVRLQFTELSFFLTAHMFTLNDPQQHADTHDSPYEAKGSCTYLRIISMY